MTISWVLLHLHSLMFLMATNNAATNHLLVSHAPMFCHWEPMPHHLCQKHSSTHWVCLCCRWYGFFVNHAHIRILWSTKKLDTSQISILAAGLLGPLHLEVWECFHPYLTHWWQVQHHQWVGKHVAHVHTTSALLPGLVARRRLAVLKGSDGAYDGRGGHWGCQPMQAGHTRSIVRGNNTSRGHCFSSSGSSLVVRGWHVRKWLETNTRVASKPFLSGCHLLLPAMQCNDLKLQFEQQKIVVQIGQPGYIKNTTFVM